MSQPVLLKVYGNFWPAGGVLAQKFTKALAVCLPEPDEPPVSLNDNLLQIAFEGIYFPVDEAVDILATSLNGLRQGKLDILDLERWKMTRYLIKNGQLVQSHAPLNNVLAYSGH